MSHTYVPANCCFCYLWSISKTNVEVLTQLKCVFCLKNHGFNSEARRGNYYTFYIEVTGALVFTTPLLNHLSPDWLSFINWRFKEQGVGLNVHIRDIHSQWFTHSKSINTSLSIWSSLLTTGSQGLRLHALTSLLEALAMFNMSIWHWNMCSHSLIWFCFRHQIYQSWRNTLQSYVCWRGIGCPPEVTLLLWAALILGIHPTRCFCACARHEIKWQTVLPLWMWPTSIV